MADGIDRSCQTHNATIIVSARASCAARVTFVVRIFRVFRFSHFTLVATVITVTVADVENDGISDCES